MYLSALLIFPLAAVVWMLLNARLGLVKDQPLMQGEETEPPQQDVQPRDNDGRAGLDTGQV